MHSCIMGKPVNNTETERRRVRPTDLREKTTTATRENLNLQQTEHIEHARMKKKQKHSHHMKRSPLK